MYKDLIKKKIFKAQETIITIIFLFISIIFMFLSKKENIYMTIIRTSILDTIIKISEPFAKSTYKIGESFNSLYELKNLRENYYQLKKENELLKDYLTSYQLIKGENKELRKFFSIIDIPAKKRVSAFVVGNISGPFNRTANIQIGSKQGVSKNNIVINNLGVVGRISEVGNYSSKILLITDFSSKIPIITSQSRQRAIAVGSNLNKLTLEYLSDPKKLILNELVFTSGDGAFFPSGFLIGTITKIENNHIEITPRVKWNELNYVQVLVD